MASLEALIKAKSPPSAEDNLETGRLYSFSEGNTYSKFCKCTCWCPNQTVQPLFKYGVLEDLAQKCVVVVMDYPATLVLIPKTTKVMTTSDYLYGCTGFACGNSDALCS